MRVLAVRHHDIDSAGFIADAFEARGAELAVHLFPDDGPLPAFEGVDHVVVLGAVSSVNDPDPWIAAEPPDDRRHRRAQQIETDSVHSDDQHVA